MLILGMMIFMALFLALPDIFASPLLSSYQDMYFAVNVVVLLLVGSCIFGTALLLKK